MTTCPSCQRVNDDDAQFCACGEFLWTTQTGLNSGEGSSAGSPTPAGRESLPPVGAATPHPGSGPPSPPAPQPGGGAPNGPDGRPTPGVRSRDGRVVYRQTAPPQGLRAVPFQPPPARPTTDPGPASGGDIDESFRGVRPDETPPTTGVSPVSGTDPGPPSSSNAGAGSGYGYGARPCYSCGRAARPDARFCACGVQLVPNQLDDGDGRPDQAPASTTPWQRLLLVGRQRREFAQQMRDAGVAPVGFDRPLAPSVIGFRVIATALVAGLVLTLVGPWRTQLRGWVDDQADRFKPHNYEDVAEVAGVAIEPGRRDFKGYAPAYAVDDFVNRAWLSAWTSGGPGQSCEGSRGTQPTLVVRFATPVRVDRLSVRSGLAEGQTDDTLRPARPRSLAVDLGETCEIVSLDNTPDRQSEVLSGAEVSVVRVWVVDAYPLADSPVEYVAISELDFETDR